VTVDALSDIARSHVEGRAIAIPEFQVLYVPIPKTAWTSTLWALAGLAGLAAADFTASTKPEVSAAMAVHDQAIWRRHGRLWRDQGDDLRAEALGSPEWFRFAVVRDPTRRLWSAWQSKLLLREPVYLGYHGEQSWYPRLPTDPDQIVADFRAFVPALAAGFATERRMRDPHWGRQSEVVDVLPLTHVGRVERLGETERALREHVAARGGPDVVFARENASPLPYTPALLDAGTVAGLRGLYARDYAALGYDEPVAPDPEQAAAQLEQWSAAARPELAHMRELVDRHQRLYTVVTQFRR
jgi:hypothetical protein